MKHVNKKVFRVSIAFALVLAGGHAVERYVALFDADPQVGIIAFSITTVFLFIGNFISPLVIGKIGEKATMVLASLFYIAWTSVFSLQEVILFYVTSAFAGLAVAFIWNSIMSYLNRVLYHESEEAQTQNNGFQWTAYAIGAIGGLLAIGGLISLDFSVHQSALMMSAVCGLGLICFIAFVPSLEISPEGQPTWSDLGRIFSNFTVLRLGLLSASAFFLYGLFVTIIPIDIESLLGQATVAFFSMTPFIVTVFSGAVMGLMVKVGAEKLVRISFLIAFIGLGLLYFVPQAWALLLGMACISFTYVFLFLLTRQLPLMVASEAEIPLVTAVINTADDVALVSGLVIAIFFPTNLLYVIAGGFLLFSLLLLWGFTGVGGFEQVRQKLAR